MTKYYINSLSAPIVKEKYFQSTLYVGVCKLKCTEEKVIYLYTVQDINREIQPIKKQQLNNSQVLIIFR